MEFEQAHETFLLLLRNMFLVCNKECAANSPVWIENNNAILGHQDVAAPQSLVVMDQIVDCFLRLFLRRLGGSAELLRKAWAAKIFLNLGKRSRTI